MSKPRRVSVIAAVLALLVGALYWLAAVPATETPAGAESRARFHPGTARFRRRIALSASRC